MKIWWTKKGISLEIFTKFYHAFHVAWGTFTNTIFGHCNIQSLTLSYVFKCSVLLTLGNHKDYNKYSKISYKLVFQINMVK